MSLEESVLHYLRGMAGEAPRARHAGGRWPFITLSRQAGAGGRELAQELLRRMGARRDPLFSDWQVFDSALCQKVAEDPKLRVSLQSLLSEDFRGSVADYLAQLIAGESPQIAVHKRIFETVRSLAAVGKAVIIGRAGSCLTRSWPLGVHVRLTAPKAARVHRMARRFNVPSEEAERWVDEQDRSRARLVRTYFHRDIEDPTLYDAVFNSESLGMPAVAEAILALVAERARSAPRERGAPV